MAKNRVSIEYEGRRVESYADCDEVVINKDTLSIKRSDCVDIKIEDLSGVNKITFTPEMALLRFFSHRGKEFQQYVIQDINKEAVSGGKE